MDDSGLSLRSQRRGRDEPCLAASGVFGALPLSVLSGGAQLNESQPIGVPVSVFLKPPD